MLFNRLGDSHLNLSMSSKTFHGLNFSLPCLSVLWCVFFFSFFLFLPHHKYYPKSHPWAFSFFLNLSIANNNSLIYSLIYTYVLSTHIYYLNVSSTVLEAGIQPWLSQTYCYGLNCAPIKFINRGSEPPMWLAHSGGALMMGLRPLEEQIPLFLPTHTKERPCEDRRKVPICNPSRKLSPETNPADTLVLKF